ncbi:LysR family transcriptional regulator [Burkholderia cepacia]|uniref:LysR family transcriptional regulator n=1 Tax=Burkholderia cepacia TaxID=292 RepID=UPI000F5F9818|nr:LysR family transcriptional regulator [Burkholderia cepacia]RQT33925.1 LysR family transcriptional regulator [Burkholderia cepacia]
MFSNTSDLDLRLIRVFLAVVDARGITAAEASLGVRQSTISTQLSALEARVGFKLCDRGRGGFRLTSKGERFAATARTLVAATSEFVARVRDIDRKLVGTLSIGLIGQAPLVENARVADAIGAFRKRDQAVTFAMKVTSPQELEESLVNNQLDLAIGYFWHRVPGLLYTPLFTEQQVIYCGRGHPLFHASRPVTADDLQQHDWVWRTYPVPEEQYPLPERRVTASADSIEAATILILSGGHLGYLPAHYAEPFEQRGLVKAVGRATFSFDVPLHLAMKRSTSDKPIVDAFCEDLLRAFNIKAAALAA